MEVAGRCDGQTALTGRQGSKCRKILGANMFLVKHIKKEVSNRDHSLGCKQSGISQANLYLLLLQL